MGHHLSPPGNGSAGSADGSALTYCDDPVYFLDGQLKISAAIGCWWRSDEGQNADETAAFAFRGCFNFGHDTRTVRFALVVNRTLICLGWVHDVNVGTKCISTATSDPVNVTASWTAEQNAPTATGLWGF